MKYLWDLDLNSLPLAWEEEYLEAMEDYPFGQFIRYKFSKGEDKVTYYSPVEYHDLCLRLFAEYREKGKYLIANQHKYDLKTLIRKIIKVDSALYLLILVWVDKALDLTTSYNPNDLLNLIEYSPNYSENFSALLPKGYEFIEDLKFLSEKEILAL